MEIRRLLENWNKFASTLEPLNEAIEDLGLPQLVVDEVNRVLVDTSPKTKTWFGNLIKKYINEGSMQSEMLESVNDVLEDLAGAATVAREDVEKTAKISSIVDQFVSLKSKFINYEALSYDERRNAVRSIASIYTKFLPKLGIQLPDYVDSDYRVNAAQRAFITDPLTIVINRFETLATALRKEEDATLEAVTQLAEQGQPIFRFEDAARAILDSEENEEQVVHRFENGFYWYDLQTTHCAIEAERLKNCGSDSRGNLYSLRWKGTKDKVSKSFVLISYNDAESKIYQIKGFEMEGETKYGNRAPPKIIKGPKGMEANLWEMIAWFINHFEVQSVVETGEYVNGSENIAKFEVMNAYLAVSTSAFFEDPVDRAAELEEECREVQRNWERRLQYFETNYDVEADGAEYAYVSYGASGTLPLEIPDLDADLNNKTLVKTIIDRISEFAVDHIDRSLMIEILYNQRIHGSDDGKINIPLSVWMEDADPDSDGYHRFCDKVDDIERAIDEITEHVKTQLEYEGWIQTKSADFDEFVNYNLQEIEDDFEHIKVRWDEDSPSEGVTFVLLQDNSGMYGVPYSFGNYRLVFAPYQADSSGTADNAYEAAYQKSMQQFHDTAVKLLEKELETVQRQAASQLEIPVGKEPAKSYSAAKIENVNVSLNRSVDDELKLSLSVNIGAFSNEDEIASAVALARYLDENADQVVALLKKELDSILKFNFDKIGLDTDQLDLVESIARAIIKRMKW